MPRSGPLGTFTLPGQQANATPLEPISSATNNQGWTDVAQTFNTVQPEAYGGTAASTFAQARINLGVSSSVVALMSARRSLVVNGSMNDSQENGNTLGTTNGFFPADQFALYFAAAGAAMSIQRVQTSRSLAGGLNKLEFKTTTAKTSLAATDSVLISQPIEGSRPDFVAAGWGTAGAKPFMFRVDQQLPAGLYHIHAQNSAGNRHIAVPFTATGSEAITEVAIPGDIAGTWLTADGTIGVVIDIVLAAGSSRTGGTASTWSGSTFYAASTQKNILDSTANVVRITDVGLRLDPDATGVYGQYEVGETDAIYRSERYVQTTYVSAGGYASVNGASFDSTVNLFTMCKAPVQGVSKEIIELLNASSGNLQNIRTTGFRYRVVATAVGPTTIAAVVLMLAKLST